MLIERAIQMKRKNLLIALLVLVVAVSTFGLSLVVSADDDGRSYWWLVLLFVVALGGYFTFKNKKE